MPKTFKLPIAIILLVLSAVFISCGNKSSFINNYEKFVVSIEKDAKNKNTKHLNTYIEKEKQFNSKATKLFESEKGISKEDKAQYTVLKIRYTIAIAQLTGQDPFASTAKALDETRSTLEDFGKELNDLGKELNDLGKKKNK